MTKTIYEILVLEDDEIDRLNIERAFKKSNIANTLHYAKNGLEGLELIRNGTVKKPLLILLDINMPKMNGLEFLTELRKDPEHALTPVVVLTSSHNDTDRYTAYKLAVAGYVVKPVIFGDFVQVMTAVGKYWAVCEFPQQEI